MVFTASDIQEEIFFVPVTEWSQTDSYNRIKTVLTSLSVTNDGAEPAVKLTHEKLCSAIIETRFQNITQVVEKDRATFPNLRKPDNS